MIDGRIIRYVRFDELHMRFRVHIRIIMHQTLQSFYVYYFVHIKQKAVLFTGLLVKSVFASEAIDYTVSFCQIWYPYTPISYYNGLKVFYLFTDLLLVFDLFKSLYSQFIEVVRDLFDHPSQRRRLQLIFHILHGGFKHQLCHTYTFSEIVTLADEITHCQHKLLLC
jgi:hypothetical protein